MEEPRVVIAIPLATPLIYWQVVASILQMEKPEETDLMVFQGALVDRARNHLVEQMLNHPIDPTHLFFMDSDILPTPETLIQLLENDQDIVSGLYRKRLSPHEPLAYTQNKSGKLIPIKMTKTKKLMMVDYVGSGCLLIKRNVFEKIKGPWFVSEWRKEGHLSEDFSFCERARKAGFKIHVDTRITPLHIEPMGIGTQDDGSVQFVSLK